MARLCIADPPYLGVANFWYGDGALHGQASAGFRPRGGNVKKADYHPEAANWDDPESHRQMVERLQSDYDGFAIAMKVSSLWHYLQWVQPGPGVHVCAWTKPNAMPTNAHPFRAWEPVLIKVPEGRRAGGRELVTLDWITSGVQATFAGAKPPRWTRWVLDMLGYDPETDTVDDLFHGSGAVSAEVAQGVLL
jgi:hypothetical protein